MNQVSHKYKWDDSKQLESLKIMQIGNNSGWNIIVRIPEIDRKCLKQHFLDIYMSDLLYLNHKNGRVKATIQGFWKKIVNFDYFYKNSWIVVYKLMESVIMDSKSYRRYTEKRDFVSQ